MMNNPFGLDDAAVERYARHLILPEIGGRGQRRLLDATVVVDGHGKAASEALMFLAAAGVGHVVVQDGLAGGEIDHARALNPGVTIAVGEAVAGAKHVEVEGDSRLLGALRAMRVIGKLVGIGDWATGGDWEGLEALASLIQDPENMR